MPDGPPVVNDMLYQPDKGSAGTVSPRVYRGEDPGFVRPPSREPFVIPNTYPGSYGDPYYQRYGLSETMRWPNPAVKYPYIPSSRSYTQMDPLTAGVHLGMMGGLSGLGFAAVYRAYQRNRGRSVSGAPWRTMLIGAIIGSTLGIVGASKARRASQSPKPPPKSWEEFGRQLQQHYTGGKSRFAGLEKLQAVRTAKQMEKQGVVVTTALVLGLLGKAIAAGFIGHGLYSGGKKIYKGVKLNDPAMARRGGLQIAGEGAFGAAAYGKLPRILSKIPYLGRLMRPGRALAKVRAAGHPRVARTLFKAKRLPMQLGFRLPLYGASIAADEYSTPLSPLPSQNYARTGVPQAAQAPVGPTLMQRIGNYLRTVKPTPAPQMRPTYGNV